MDIKINQFIDHTLLSPTATKEQILKLCEEAKKYHFFSVCINPANIDYAKTILKDSDVAICTVIGFPLGANTTETKVFETSDAIKKGATEIDMVINIAALKDKNFDYIENEIRAIKKVCGKNILKVIFETCLLSDEEIIKASKISEKAGADFIKTSTGFSTSGATPEHVKVMKSAISNKMKIKASGGIRSLPSAKEYIELGCERLGTSSGVAILEGLKIATSGY
jgi:deoxyribose-phosphate aldolase